MLILFIKSQLSLFDTPVHVGAHVRKDGTVVKPHTRIQKVALKQAKSPRKPKQAEQARQGVLFASEAAKNPTTYATITKDPIDTSSVAWETPRGTRCEITLLRNVKLTSNGYVVAPTHEIKLSVNGSAESFYGIKDDAAGLAVQARMGQASAQVPAAQADAVRALVSEYRSNNDAAIAAQTAASAKYQAHHDAVERMRTTGSASGFSQPNSQDEGIIEHTTKKGKTLRGIIRRDLTLDEARGIDQYTFRKDGGYFIREKHLQGDAQTEAKQPQTRARPQRKVVPKQADSIKKEGGSRSASSAPHDAGAPFGVAAGITKGKRREINAKVVDLLQKDGPYSDDELALMRQYSGTGGIGDSLNEYYTDPEVAVSMWAVLAKLGIEGGEILEPSCATGVFMHTAPEGARVIGVELDSVSSKIAQALHGDRHEVQNASLERFAHQDGGRQFDAVIGNAPFGLRGSLLKDDKPDIRTAEGYFLDTSIDKLKPGGVVAMIVPTGVLDARSNRSLRERLLRKAEFLGAVRMPNTAFEHSHTEVTTDIVFFRKRPDEVGNALMTVDQGTLRELGVWDDEYLSGTYFEGRGAPNIFGVMEPGWRAKAGIGQDITVSGSMIGVAEAVASWSPDVFQTARPTVQDVLDALGEDEDALQRALGATLKRAYGDVKVGDTKVVDGVTYILQGDPPRWHRLDEFMQDAAVSEAQPLAEDIERLTQGDEVDRADLQARINAYIEKFGNPGQNPNLHIAAGRNKALYRLIGAVGADGSFSDLVAGRQAQRIGGSVGAVAVSLSLSRIDGLFSADELAERSDMSVDEVEDLMMASSEYSYASDDHWTTTAQYLTGELWPKLDFVREELKRSDLPAGLAEKYTIQARQLEEAIDPRSLEDVEIMLNSAFIPTEVIAAFFNDQKAAQAATSTWARDAKDYEITYDGGLYTIRGGLYNSDLLSKYLNRTGVRKDDLPTIERWNEDFKVWLLSSRYRDEIEDLYNRKFRGFVERKFSNDTIDIPGLSGEGLKEYQYGGLRWALSAGKGIIAADVGLGKTVRGLMLARMAKVNGTASKPTFVVPKSVLANWVAEAEKWFPGSRVMVIGETYTKDKSGNLKSKTDSAAVRNQKLHALTQNDYDFVLISQPAFNDIDLDPITKGEYINEDFWVMRGDKLGNAGDKRLNKIRTAYDQAIASRDFQKRTDAIFFNQTGIDMLIIDEAHAYKNLYSSRNRYGQSPKFLGGQGLSNRALDMNLKARWVRESNDGKNVFMLTATPTKNSPLEVYSMLSHIAPEAFERIGVRNSEEFLDRFCVFEQDKILGTSGTIEDALVTAGFKNMDELREIMKRYIDRTTAKDVGLVLPERKESMHMIDMTPQQQEVYASLREQMVEAAKERDATGDAHVFSIMDRMAKAAMDLELLGSEYAGARSPKYDHVAKQAAEGARDGGQIIFSESIETHEKIASALVSQGIPRDQIAIINAQAAASSAARQNISDAFNSGKVKVVIGNRTMEEGVNLQKKTSDIHHMDLPWEPASLQQRNGRGLRQGNKNEAVRIHTYISKGSFDGYRYQSMMAKKDWQDDLWSGGDRIENMAREGKFDRSDLMIMLSADPEAERAKFESDKAAAQERHDAEKGQEAAAAFTRMQVMQRSYRDLKNKDTQSAVRLASRIDRAKTVLMNNKYFKAKAALSLDVPAIIAAGTDIPVYSGAGFEIVDKDGGKAKWVVDAVSIETGDVTFRPYAGLGASNRKVRILSQSLSGHLSGAKAFAYDAGEEDAAIAKKIEENAVSKAGSLSSWDDVVSLPPSVLQSHHDNIQRQMKDATKAHSFRMPYSADTVPMIHRETGAAEAFASYEHTRKHESHDYMLPTEGNRKKAIAAYIEDQRARTFGLRHESGRRRFSSGTQRFVEKYPGSYDQRSNRWKAAGSMVFGSGFEAEAERAFTQDQNARIRRAPTFNDALIMATKAAEFGHSEVPKWPKRALATLFARARRDGTIDSSFAEVATSAGAMGGDSSDVPKRLWDYRAGSQVRNATSPYDKHSVGGALAALAGASGHYDLAAAMIVSAGRDKDPAGVLAALRKLPSSDATVIQAIRHMTDKYPELGASKEAA